MQTLFTRCEARLQLAESGVLTRSQFLLARVQAQTLPVADGDSLCVYISEMPLISRAKLFFVFPHTFCQKYHKDRHSRGWIAATGNKRDSEGDCRPSSVVKVKIRHFIRFCSFLSRKKYMPTESNPFKSAQDSLPLNAWKTQRIIKVFNGRVTPWINRLFRTSKNLHDHRDEHVLTLQTGCTYLNSVIAYCREPNPNANMGSVFSVTGFSYELKKPWSELDPWLLFYCDVQPVNLDSIRGLHSPSNGSGFSETMLSPFTRKFPVSVSLDTPCFESMLLRKNVVFSAREGTWFYCWFIWKGACSRKEQI